MRLRDRRKTDNKKSWEEEKPPKQKYRKPPRKTGIDNDGKLKGFVFVSRHCIKRFLERIPELRDLEFEKLRGMILAMYRDGCLFGGQSGDDFLVLSKHRRTGREVVFACTVDDNEKGKITILKTTLSLEHAKGNIEQREMKNPEISLNSMKLPSNCS